MKRKILLTIPLATLAVAALAPAPIAWGHTGTASGTCNGGVAWQFQNYDKTVTNTITVTIDGTVRHHDPDMKASDAGTIATDKTVGHSWSVVVNAPGVTHDKAFNGLYPACVTVAPTTTVASSTTVVTTTTASPTTSVPDVATTVVTDPTTTVVAVGEPPVPSSVALAPPVTIAAGVAEEPVLPRTGGGDGVLVLAVVLVLCGFALLVVRGRRVP